MDPMPFQRAPSPHLCKDEIKEQSGTFGTQGLMSEPSVSGMIWQQKIKTNSELHLAALYFEEEWVKQFWKSFNCVIRMSK